MCDDCDAKIRQALSKLSLSVSVSKTYAEFSEGEGVKVEVELMYDYETIAKSSDYTILN